MNMQVSRTLWRTIGRWQVLIWQVNLEIFQGSRLFLQLAMLHR
jgi:hypothetical protein